MASIEPESSPPDWRTVIHELVKGRESATRLRILLQEASPPGSRGPDSIVRVLIDEVLVSFSRALSELDASEKPEIRACPEVITTIALPYSDDRRSENSGVKRKIQPARRGAYRRRANPDLCTRITSKKLDDGHSWRKYGQKEIYSSKFPRSYYRCTHKSDQGCQATRQVQRSEEEPTLFTITYMGEHTCKDLMKTMASHHKIPYLISFGSNTTTTDRLPEQPSLSSSFPTLKQEPDEEALISNLIPSGGSSSDYLALPNLPAFGGSEPMEQAGGASTSDHKSGLHSPTSTLDLDLDFMVDSFELDNVFSFDNDELFRNFFEDGEGLNSS